MYPSTLTTLLTSKIASADEKEEAILSATSTLASPDIPTFLKELPNIWRDISLARTTKIIKRILGTKQINIETLNLIDSLILIYTDKKLLRFDLEAKRIELLHLLGNYQECLSSISGLIKELKKHDDKVNLLTLYVCESKAFYRLKNIPRARSSLTAARALAVSTFCPTDIQAQIDLLSGMYVCDERNYETAYSYFLESIDGFIIEKRYEESVLVLRYLVLAKIIGEKYKDVDAIIKKFEEKIVNACNDALILLLKEINQCCLNRDLNEYRSLMTKNSVEDEFIARHLNFLYDRLFENNLIKIIGPYINVSIKYISDNVNMAEDVVEVKLRQMILDGKIHGIMDHVGRCLNLFGERKKGSGSESAELIDECITFASKIKN